MDSTTERFTKTSERVQLSLTVIEAFPDPCFIVEANGNIGDANSRALELLHCNRDDIVGTVFQSLLESHLQPQFRHFFHQCLSSGSSHAFETFFVAKNNGQQNVVLYLSRHPKNLSTDEKPLGVIVARDITELKKKELELLRFTNVAHYTVNPIEITDTNGRIIYVNPAFERVSGFTKQELIGQNPKIFGSGKHPKSFWDKMWQTINEGKVWMGEVENRRRNGEPFFTQILISPIIDNNGTIIGYFGVHRDVTEQRALQQQLIHAQKMESIGLLAAGIAHEVGNPLTSISSLVQIIQRTTQDEFAQEKLELIKSQITRISRIIRDLVDFSRRSSYEIQMTDINKSIREAVEIVRVGRKAKEISFVVELDEHIPQLPLVPDQMDQVFINILINAVDAINADSGRAEKKTPACITARSRMNEDSLTVTISDTGKGISEDQLPKIFEPFFTTKKVGEGTGLGLWVSYGIIKSFRGSIAVESADGGGATFTITLPLQQHIP